MDIHFSELQAWRRCEQKWYNSYHLNLQLPTLNDNMRFGGLWAHISAAYHTAMMDEPTNSLDGMAVAMLYYDYLTEEGGEYAGSDPRHLIPKLLQEYAAVVGGRMIVRGVEVELAAFIDNGISFVCTLDGIVEWENQLWVLEHKTTSSGGTGHLLLDPQGLCYTWAARQLGYNVAGTLYVQVRKVDPSRAQSSVITVTPVAWSGEAVDRIWETQYKVSLENLMQAKRWASTDVEYLRIFNPIPWMSCFCDFENLCKAWLMGGKDREVAARSMYDITD